MKQQTWQLKIAANHKVGSTSDVEKKEQIQDVSVAIKIFYRYLVTMNVNANIGHQKTLVPMLQHSVRPTIQVEPRIYTSGLVATTAMIQHLIHVMPKHGMVAVLILTAIAVDRTLEGDE